MLLASKDIKMNETVNEGQATGSGSESPTTNESIPAPVPEGMIVINETYHFRATDKTEANIAKLPREGAEHEFVVEDIAVLDDKDVATGEFKMKRKMETYGLLLPTPAGLGVIATEGQDPDKQAVVLQHLIKEAVAKIGRGLVNTGKLVTDTNCSWSVAVEALYKTITTGGGEGGASYNAELLAEVAKLFAEYSKSIQKPENGIEATCKMIKSRFGKMATRKYINGLTIIETNILDWFENGLDEDQQAELEPVCQYLVDRIAVALEPEEVVDVGSMF